MRLEGLGKLEKNNDLIDTRTHDLPACSIVSQPTTLPRVSILLVCSVSILSFLRG
jgi:hypothetical protein